MPTNNTWKKIAGKWSHRITGHACVLATAWMTLAGLSVHGQAAEALGNEVTEEEIEDAVAQAVAEAVAEAAAEVREEAGDPPRQTNARLSNLPDLPVGHAGDGDNSGGRATSFRFTAESPGLLTVAVRAKTGEDMTINVMNAQGRTLPNGRCDIDYNGDVGSEHLTVTLAEAGDYEIAIEPLGNGGPFWISGSWLVVDELGDLAPKKPNDARKLNPNDTVESEVLGDRMSQDWYQFTAPSDGLVIVDVNGRGGDIVLEIFMNQDFFEPAEYIDGDRRGGTSNELYTGDLVEGEMVFIRVVSQSSSGTTYRARARFLPAGDIPEQAE